MIIEFQQPACVQKQQGAHHCLGGQVIHKRGCCSSVVVLFPPFFLESQQMDQVRPQRLCAPEMRAPLVRCNV